MLADATTDAVWGEPRLLAISHHHGSVWSHEQNVFEEGGDDFWAWPVSMVTEVEILKDWMDEVLSKSRGVFMQ